jgi:fructose-1,6-bisphosphatase/inositol monophosphatase family enzyme
MEHLDLSSQRIRETLHLIRKVGRFLDDERQRIAGDLDFKNKGVGRVVDPVTPLDLRSNELLKQGLREILPAPFVSEETGGEGKEFYWLVDPLDGTNNFMNGLPLYAISIALVKEEEPIFGAVYAPALRQLFWAKKGGGAYLGRKPLHISSRPIELWISELATQPSSLDELARIAPLFGRIRAFRVLGSMALSLAYTAAGKLDLFLGAGYPWDIAGGMVILKEAGGVLYTLEGKERRLSEKVWSAGGSREAVSLFFREISG